MLQCCHLVDIKWQCCSNVASREFVGRNSRHSSQVNSLTTELLYMHLYIHHMRLDFFYFEILSTMIISSCSAEWASDFWFFLLEDWWQLTWQVCLCRIHSLLYSIYEKLKLWKHGICVIVFNGSKVNYHGVQCKYLWIACVQKYDRMIPFPVSNWKWG